MLFKFDKTGPNLWDLLGDLILEKAHRLRKNIKMWCLIQINKKHFRQKTSTFSTNVPMKQVELVPLWGGIDFLLNSSKDTN